MKLKELCHMKVELGKDDEIIKLYSKNTEIIAWGTWTELLGTLGYRFLECEALEKNYDSIGNTVTIDCEVEINV